MQWCVCNCVKEDRSYEVSVSRMIEALKNMCVKDGYSNNVSVVMC